MDLAYSVRGKEVTIVSMFSDNVQYQMKKTLKVMRIMNEEKHLLEGVYMDRELNASIGRELKMLLDSHDYMVITNKLAGVMEMALSLDKLNTDNLEDGRLSSVYVVTA